MRLSGTASSVDVLVIWKSVLVKTPLFCYFSKILWFFFFFFLGKHKNICILFGLMFIWNSGPLKPEIFTRWEEILLKLCSRWSQKLIEKDTDLPLVSVYVSHNHTLQPRCTVPSVHHTCTAPSSLWLSSIIGRKRSFTYRCSLYNVGPVDGIYARCVDNPVWNSCHGKSQRSCVLICVTA